MYCRAININININSGAFPFGYLVFGYLFFLYPGNPRGKGASTSIHFLTLHTLRAQGESVQC